MKMPTLLEVLNKSVEFLKGKEVPNAKFDAECLFAYGLKCKRLQLYLDFEKVMPEDALNIIRPLVVRRGKREPLQHILGEVDFCDIKLKTNKNALIPRPETEELIELIGNKLRKEPESIIDLGTGTGAIALSLAKLYPQANVTAVDKSKEALKLAKENAQLNELERVEFVESNWFDGVNSEFDLIVSNPPYLTEEEYESAQAEVKEYEPKMALYADDEGIADLVTLLKNGYTHLKDSGLIAFETGIQHHEALSKIAQEIGYQSNESHKDFSKRDRFFIAVK